MMATISLILFLILSLEKKILGIVKKDQVSLVGGNVPMHLTTKEFLLVRPA